MGFAVVLAGGDVPDARLLTDYRDAALVIAADSGVRIARTHGLPIHIVIGDLDSASEGDRAWAIAEGAEIVEHPTDKDETDLELALGTADEADVDSIVVVGITGGRLDHELGNWSVVCAPRRAQVEVRTASGTALVLNGETTRSLELDGAVGELISLLPRGGPAHGVTTSGLRWELDRATLHQNRARGVSNEFAARTATISVERGTLMVVRPAGS